MSNYPTVTTPVETKASDLLAQVREEQKELTARLKHLAIAAEALSSLVGERAPYSPVQAPTNRPPASKTQMIKEVLSNHPAGMAPKEIKDVLEAQGVSLPAGEIHTYLHRLTNRDQVVRRGPQGSGRYFFKG